ncbi:CvpA family protein [Fusibacillus kribbianus]|uniref:CvpA family protein n=1 Tax=Fusibacillus kribbianus TaxID=3044208 RepID=A0AAP4EZY3_9FIRM|nr:CvpA family protein [Ruminococcus sp. YH-rum2234]MDI9242455.1 CvpA family protein [Ruminococcus sp. YH-rum2234]
MEINFVLIAAALILLLSIIIGGAKGLLRSSLSLIALILSGIIVMALNPIVTGFLRDHTKLDEWIEAKIENMIASEMNMETTDDGETIVLGKDVTLPTDVQLPDGTVFPAGTVLSAGTVLPKGIGFDEFREQVDAELSTTQQSKIIEMLPVPENLRESLEANNNTAVYQQLGVERFTDYIGSFISNICLSIIGYVVTFLLVFFALHILILAFDIVDRLPIIHGINHFAGALLGILKGLLILEILFLVLIPFATTDFGKNVMAQINNNGFLSLLYNNNILMKLMMGIMGKGV